MFIAIKENRDFRRIYTKGKSYVSPIVVTYVLKNRSRNLRAGITTSKKTGNAVLRNRSRRIMREAFRQASPQIKEGYDFILVARGRTPFVKSTDIYRVLMRQLKDAGVLK
ncbi:MULTISPECIES: ribonuclease P protein component [Eubacteriales]|uniref:ribonuclease P protein component n=1 Tax=Eubacteriales TaxID=186802 RepID=UPI000680504F|nr:MULTISPECIES: ribonuclease P protein component [Eubacteriales]